MVRWKLLVGVALSVVPALSGVVIGSTPKGRMIEIDAVVSVSPGKAFDLWTNVDSIKKFFAPVATIERNVGGRYEMAFEPEKDPQGRDFGTYGCKVLEYDPGRHLAFEWKGPPWATEMNGKPFPTRVDVQFDPARRRANRTHVTLTHSGFGTGTHWDKSYDYFDRAWRKVLVRFEAFTAALSAPTAQSIQSHRHLEKEVIVKAPIEQVWSAWTTSEGMATFFAPKSKIELAIGGAFELYIEPDSPEGSRGCEGCTVLSYEPMEMLSFSWNAPPSIPALRDANIRSRVVLYFDDLHDGRVKVTLRHLGFGEGEDWDKCLKYFDSAWPYVLNNLKEKIADVPVNESVKAATPPMQSKNVQGATHSIHDFAWLAGCWEGELSYGRFEQIWSKPQGGVMIGMFRLMQDGNPTMLEFMTLAENADGVEFRFRHFSLTLMATEEKDNPSILRLVGIDGDVSTFVNPVHGRPKRTVIVREGFDRYTARSEIVRDGETTVFESHARRKRKK